jgi:hypothetical protein
MCCVPACQLNISCSSMLIPSPPITSVLLQHDYHLPGCDVIPSVQDMTISKVKLPFFLNCLILCGLIEKCTKIMLVSYSQYEI